MWRRPAQAQIPALQAPREAARPPRRDPEGTGSQETVASLTTFHCTPKNTTQEKGGINYYNVRGVRRPPRRKRGNRRLGAGHREAPLTWRTGGGPSIAAPPAARRGTAHARPAAGRGRRSARPASERREGPAGASRPLAAGEGPRLWPAPGAVTDLLACESVSAGFGVSLARPACQPPAPEPPAGSLAARAAPRRAPPLPQLSPRAHVRESKRQGQALFLPVRGRRSWFPERRL